MSRQRFAALFVFFAVLVAPLGLRNESRSHDELVASRAIGRCDTVVEQDGTTGYGSVPYSYNIGTNDVTNTQYAAFLNANDPTVGGTAGPVQQSHEQCHIRRNQLQFRGPCREHVQRDLRQGQPFCKLCHLVRRGPLHQSMDLRRIGEQFAAQQRWREAAFFSACCLRRDERNSHTSVQAAALLLTCGDDAGYRTLYQQMVKRFADSESPFRRRTRRQGRADRCRNDEKRSSKIVSAGGDRSQGRADRKQLYLGYFQLTGGMAEFRSGRFDAAIEWFDRSLRRRPGEKMVRCRGLSDLYKAMTFHHLGRRRRARMILERANAAVDGHFAVFSIIRSNWHDWLSCRYRPTRPPRHSS